MKKRIIVIGTHDYGLGSRLAEIVAKFRLSDVIKSVCEDEELQPIECEKHGSCKNCPYYKPVKQTVLQRFAACRQGGLLTTELE